ncbi:mannose-1-phosphate guanylyltransferase, partial [Hansschlegelia zhihuaiae]|uniref:mannose-1-phosphate guanylyltransferase n=1 Tax=Hansschlegelia zhihuaiae TaxID=405005 RepID=UPI001FE1364C
MTARLVTPIILCGGTGSRLWPASRESYPKQFLSLAGEKTLLQATLLRVSDPARFAEPIVVANHEHRFIVAEQVEQLGLKPTIVLEPCRRGTAAAICAAMRMAEARDPEALGLALASDHVVSDEAAFLQAVETGLAAALAGRIVTFGLKPTEPTSKYGYILAGDAVAEAPGVSAVSSFVEKPERAKAERLLADGAYWNSGNFLALARTLISETTRLAPGVATPAVAAADKAARDLDFVRLDAESFAAAEASSFDHAV